MPGMKRLYHQIFFAFFKSSKRIGYLCIEFGQILLYSFIFSFIISLNP
ncbi:hypothetical protein HMPREF3213_03236 [Heyndrickxia coagulans]|uniref:Uncharacterized protein n=1 Tax=Heyndrickxia coagulans TaxID=1398 RepID=A0A133KE22_HEYCO|nr:hypothetical protein HMPREF3213_03236 [Heyndrickxia coagulans]